MIAYGSLNFEARVFEASLWKLWRRESVEDDVGNAGERRLEGSNRRRKLLALGIAIAWTNSAAKPHEVDSSA